MRPYHGVGREGVSHLATNLHPIQASLSLENTTVNFFSVSQVHGSVGAACLHGCSGHNGGCVGGGFPHLVGLEQAVAGKF